MFAAIQQFKSWLVEPTDGRVIGFFRLLFGSFMVYYTYYYYKIGFIPEGLLKSKLLFKYDYFDWVPLFSAPVMYTILALMGVSALLIAMGLFFRWACWVFSLCLAFFLFQEKSYYNNHIYLFILLPLVLSATDADRFLSLRKTPNSKLQTPNSKLPTSNSKLQTPNSKLQTPNSQLQTPNSKLQTSNFVIPRYQQFVLQVQILIVYFFAGVVKLKADWLVRMEPMKSMIHQFPDQHWMAPLIKHDVNIYLFNYGGVLLDILAPFLLLYKPVRNWAWIPFALFHLTNSQLFDDISIFPFVMLGAMILFFDTDEIPLLRNSVQKNAAGRVTEKRKNNQAEAPAFALPVHPAWATKLLLGYFVFQLLFPLRGFFLPNPLDYTTIGNRFAWRVKADMRLPDEMTFTVEHPQSGESSKVNIQSYLNPMQIRTLAMDPRAVRDFAQFLREELAKQGVSGVLVKARIRFGYNGRPPQFFVEPEADLASVRYSPFKKMEWLVPLEQ